MKNIGLLTAILAFAAMPLQLSPRVAPALLII